MGKLLNKVLCFVLLMLALTANSQSYPFVNYTIENGISSGQVLCAFQNDDGVMWFGTSGGGISMFDGKTFEYLTDKEGLADNVVFCIKKDKSGNILIGTNNGLSVYDPSLPPNSKTPRFRNYTTKEGLSHNRIFAIMFDENGTAVMGTSRGISTYKDRVCAKMKIDAKLDTSVIFNVMKDSQKNLWCSSLGAGVFKYDGNLTINYSTKDGLANDNILSIAEVAHNTIWFLTGEGLYEFIDGKFDDINPAGLDSNTTYYTCYKDKNNSLWIGTQTGLIKRKSDGTVSVFRRKNGLVDNSIWSIFQDRESNLWFISDQNGVSKLSSERFFLYNNKDSLIYDEVKAINQTDDGEYWLGTKIGLSRFKNGRSRNYINKQLASGNADLWDIKDNGKGITYIGTSNGLLLMEGERVKRINSREKDTKINTILSIYMYDNGEVLLGTQEGLAKIKDGFLEPFNEMAVPKTLVNRIVSDNNGNYWFCTEDGLYMGNEKTMRHFTEKDGVPVCRVKNVVFSDEKTFWLATSLGVFVYENNKAINVTDTLGLTTKEAYSIIKDHNGHIWAGMSSGVAQIDVDGTHKIRYYEEADGFMGQVCQQNCLMIDKNDNLCIGASKGLVIYQQQYDADNVLEPITKIKRIDLFYQPNTDWSLHTDSITSGGLPYTLELAYDQNYLTFHFIGVSLTAPGKVSYKFMLKGFEKEWQYGKKTDMSYTNISPGNYEFILYANNGEGVWSKEPVVFKFTIAPPFWRTWWFYGLIAAIILSGIYSYIRIRAANTQIMKQSMIIDKKNETLQHLNEEIAEKNRDITDSINYARRIQRSFITSDKVMDRLLNEHFVLFKPRDIVSGDFYLAFEMHDRTVVVCADSTGHGIPGSFMSLIGISILNEIGRSRTFIDTWEILEEIRRIIIEALNPEKLETGGKDGMDISLVSIFKKPENGMIKIHFSGANNSVCLVSAKEGKVKMYEYKGDKQPVGYYSQMKEFTHTEIFAQKGDIIYMFTDGYADQFGGPRGRKFMSSQLKQQIVTLYDKPLKEQKEILDKALVDWQGDLEQIDDITVIGIKL